MRWFVVVLYVVLSFPAFAGPFHLADEPEFFDPFIVVHPPGYNGTGGPLEVKVCADSQTRYAVNFAIAKWNALDRTTGNCTGCRLWEEGDSGSDSPYSMGTALLHEMGHCALGLGHINWRDPNALLNTSYTNATEVGIYNDGADDIRGSADDGVGPPAGVRLIHWYRKADNDPFVIDGITIDGATYTRRKADLPTGHSWSANGNRGVALLLGHADTQSVMYSGSDRAQRYHGLTADGVNTVAFAMSGLDETAGTADDYTIELSYVADCADADIEVRYQPLSSGLGQCTADLASLAPPGQLDVHHALKPFPTESIILIDINSNLDWDVSVFGDGFEDGTTNSWSTTP